MKLSKTITAIIIAGAIATTARITPLYAGSGTYCEHGSHGPGHFSMNHGHGLMHENQERMIDNMSRNLDLSDEQRDQLHAILDEYGPRMRESRNAIHDGMKRLHEIDAGNENYMSGLDELADQQGSLVADMIRLHAGVHIELQRLLTDEQKSKLNEMNQMHDHHHDDHHHDDHHHDGRHHDGRHHQGKHGHG